MIDHRLSTNLLEQDHNLSGPELDHPQLDKHLTPHTYPYNYCSPYSSCRSESSKY